MGLVLLLSACQIGASTKNDNQAATKEATVELNRTTTPTLFFMVTQELKNSFGSLLHRLEKQGATTQELVLLVKPDGTVVKRARSFKWQKRRIPVFKFYLKIIKKQ